MNFSFELPRNNKELLESANANQYFVKNVYNSDELTQLIRNASQEFNSKGAFFIFDHFDTFFSVIENVSRLEFSKLMRTIDILYSTAANMGEQLDSYLKKDNLDRQNDFLNLIKMVMYLLVNIVRVIDAFVKENYQETTRRKSKKNADELPTTTYERKRCEVLFLVCNIMQMPIEKLWNMSMIDENFVNLLCDLAYRTLTHPSTKEKLINDTIFQMLGIAIKQYRHGIVFPVQIVDIMDREESAIAPIAIGVQYLNDEFGIKTVMAKLLNELIDKVNLNRSSQTTSKNLSLFITKIGEISVELSLKCLEMAHDLLGLEPYGIRNSLFGVINVIIVNHLTGDHLNDDQKELRDDCLEDLWNHMNDVSSYVRAKVLQIWNDLKNKNAVPLVWIIQVVARTIERLEDRTATVRRNAIILLRSFLESNPFASKLQLEEIERKLMAEKRTAAYIREKLREQIQNRAEITSDYTTRCEPQLRDIFTEILTNEEHTNELIRKGIQTDIVEANKRIHTIRMYLKEGNFNDVAELIIQSDALSGNHNVWMNMRIEERVYYFIKLLESYLFDDYEGQLESQNGIVEFFEEAFAFSNAMSSAVPKLEQMLLSTTNSDVLEAIEFFKTGYLFKIKGTETGMRLMLRLLYINTGQDKNEKGEAVVDAYHKVLFDTDATGQAHHLKVVDNLCDFVKYITTDEYTAFELMIKHWVLSNDININTINVLFQRFTFKLPHTSHDLARCCLELLILVSNAMPVVAHSNTKLIIEVLNSRRILQDPRIFANCLKMLMIAFQPTNEKGHQVNKVGGFSKRFDDKEVIDNVIGTFKKFFFFPKLTDFELIATQCIDFVYKVCNQPDILGQEIIHAVCKQLNEISKKRAEKSLEVATNEGESSQATKMFIPKYLLPRILFVFGYIASSELVFLDNDVYQNVKYRKGLRRKGKNNSVLNMDGSMNDTSKQQSTIQNISATDAHEQVYLGATAEDDLADAIINICDNELIGSTDGLLFHFVPILVAILRNPQTYSEQYVQRAAVLTLMRFMVVSANFCSQQIAFLMNILKKSKSASMKCNIIIGLADLTGRFANTLEPWIPNFYTMLLETDVTVRLSTIKMISYMLLQGTIRVTGHISDMAICIVDESIEIRGYAKEFFRQLITSKEMEYYKVLPDIISRLSSTQSPITESKFQIIMEYVLGLIKKDRRVESLVEKLCSRFQNTNNERQWRDSAFCLSLLNHTEKTMKKLIDNLPNYRDKIQCDEIYDHFKTIISNANKQIQKPELKLLAKSLDSKLQRILEHGPQVNESMDDSFLEAETVPQQQTPQSKPKGKEKRQKHGNKKNVPTKSNRKRQIISSDDDDDFE